MNTVITIPRKNKGVAIIAALLVLSICTIIVTKLLTEQRMLFVLTDNIIKADRAMTLHTSVEDYVISLISDHMDASPEYENRLYKKETHKPLTITEETDSGALHITIDYSVGGKLNLNDLLLASPQDPMHGTLERLAKSLGISAIQIDKLRSMVTATKEQNEPQLNYSYDLSEVWNKETLTTLSKYITILPKESKININLASYEVLRALVDYRHPNELEEMINRKKEKPFTSVEQFLQYFPATDRNNALKQMLTVNIDTIVATSDILIGNDTITHASILQKTPHNEKVRIVDRAIIGTSS